MMDAITKWCEYLQKRYENGSITETEYRADLSQMAAMLTGME